MKIKQFSANLYEQNSYLIEFKNNHAIIIDPGMNGVELNDYLSTNQLILDRIFLTHSHFDHIFGIRLLKKDHHFVLSLHLAEKDFINQNHFNYASYYQETFQLPKSIIVECFKDQDEFFFDDFILKVYHTPGHTIGSSIFQIQNHLFVGDTLFTSGIARTDLFTGSSKDLKKSLTMIFEHFSSSTMIYPGHNQPKRLKDIQKILP